MSNLANLTPSNITSRSVQFNGIVVSGSENIRLHWGGIDGLQVAANWSNHLDIGTFSASFSATITGLVPGYIYYITASDVAETDWANTTGSPAKVFSTLNEPQSIPNALSGSRLLAHMRSPLGQKWAEPICPKQFIQSFSGNVADTPSIKTYYSVSSAKIELDYTKVSAGHFNYTETFTTYNSDGSIRFSESPQDQTHQPLHFDSDSGASGVILPVSPRPQGAGWTNELGVTTTFPTEAWILRKGTWRINVSTAVDAVVPPVGGGAHYPISLWGRPHRTFSLGGPKQRRFWQDAVAGNDGLGGPVTRTVYTYLRSSCYWEIYFALGANVDDAAIPNGSHLCSFTVQATRIGS